MRLYYKKNWISAILSSSFLNIDEVSKYKIQKKYSKKISFYLFGFILEENFEKIKKGEIYDPVNDKIIIGDVQESSADIYKLQWKYPFYKKEYSLKEVSPANGYHEYSIHQ